MSQSITPPEVQRDSSPVFLPMKVDGPTAAFGATGKELKAMTPSSIPDEFRRRNTPWHRIVSTWFFSGLPADTDFFPKPAIDAKDAIAHVAAILRSFEPSHEDKEAICAYLLSLWFDKIDIPERAP